MHNGSGSGTIFSYMYMYYYWITVYMLSKSLYEWDEVTEYYPPLYILTPNSWLLKFNDQRECITVY